MLVQFFWMIFLQKNTFLCQKHLFLHQESLRFFGSFFFDIFLIFFQIPSRTWGINFDTIACVFELVDDPKKCLIFSTFFSKKYFSKIFLGGPIHSFPTLRSGQKHISKIFIFSSYATLFYPILPQKCSYEVESLEID